MEAKSSATAALLAQADRHLMQNYRPARLIMAKGAGSELFDLEGKRYLDFCAGVAVCCLGHGHPALTETIAQQAARLVHVSNYFYTEENVRLAADLCAATGFDRVFFCNSGTEANEALIKAVRRHFHEQGAPRNRIIAFEQAFHGRSLGSLALTGNPAYLTGFGEPLAGIEHVPFGDLAALEARMGSDVAAVVVEPVQGEGGVNVAPDGFLAGVRRICDAHGALLAVDEIQVGMGRTGRLLALDHVGVSADLVTLAKGLGGGFPIGAVLFRESLAGALPPGSHGSTFGGNSLATAVGAAVLGIVRDEAFLAAVRARGERLGAGLAEVAKKHPKLCERERGLGLLRAIALRDDAPPSRDVVAAAREHGLLITAASATAIRFTPPLVVTDAEIDEAVGLVDTTLGAL